MNWIVSSNKVVHHLECIFCPKLRRQPLEKLEDAKKLGYLPCRICITKSGQWSNVNFQLSPLLLSQKGNFNENVSSRHCQLNQASSKLSTIIPDSINRSRT